MLRQFMRNLIATKTNFVRSVGSGAEPTDAFARNSVSKEEKLSQTLKKSLPGITYLSVHDISGGCGAMYEISIEAKEFSGLTMVKQHRLVTDALKTEISEMHGIRIHTTPPSKS
ncbi:bolA-like protein domain-containing protein [Phthorimaea operculella]|nr:bolA-like protein domain-containing protein [Phthorimaea operculella]